MSKLGVHTTHDAHGDIRTRKRLTHNPVRRLAAAVAAIALGAGLALVGIAAPASAHHNTIVPSVVCDSDGTPSITWTVKNSESDKNETITASSNPDVVPVGAEIKKGKSESFEQNDVAPGTYSLELEALWTSSGATSTDSGSITITDAQCDDVPTVKKITFCHATHSETNPFVKITTSVNAFFRSGHDKHQDLEDVYPTFSYVKKGKTYTVEANGDQDLLLTDDCTKPEQPEPGTFNIPAQPDLLDVCGIDRDGFTKPNDTEFFTWSVSPIDENGHQTITVAINTEKTDKTFPDGSTSKTFEHTFSTEACDPETPEVVTITDIPSAVDLCGTENDEFTQPENTDAITWAHAGSVESGQVVITATANEGYEFADGTQVAWPFTFTDKPCGEEPEQPSEPSLDGSVATGVCLADAPWIFFDVTLTDPDGEATSHDASLVLSDGTNTETIALGTIGDSGKLQGKVLWPGASVDDEGNANGWPGWKQLDDGTWVQTDGNFAWTRNLTSAELVVNPELKVALAYPPATPDCIAAPPVDPTDPGEGDGDSPATPAATGSQDLAETGFAGTSIAIVAGVIVLAGVAFVVVARLRRKKA